MKRVFTLLLSICMTLSCLAQSAVDLCETGRQAFADGKFEEAKVYLTKAANMGNAKACGLLGLGYMSGLFHSGEDLNAAIRWANYGYTCNLIKPDPVCVGVIGLLGTSMAQNKKGWIDHMDLLEYAYENGFDSSNIGNRISVCYLLKGNKDKAMEWASRIKSIESKEDNKDDYYMSSAIISKIYLDRKDYANAIIEARDAAVYGNPIALYVMGKSQIKTDLYPAIGQNRVREAAQYDYNLISDINVFADEIQKYYNSIRNKKFKQ